MEFHLNNHVGKGVAALAGAGMCLSLLGLTPPSRAMAAGVAEDPPACTVGTSTIAQCFPDAELAKIVAAAASTSTSGVLDSYAIGQVTKLSHYQSGVDDAKITNLEGIQYLTSLTSLTIDHSAITDLSPLSGLTSLTTLDLDSNGVVDAGPLATDTNLESLSLNGNKLTNAGISKLKNLTKLTYLHLDANTGITDISNLPKHLKDLSLTGTGVSDIGPLADMHELESLDLMDVRFTSTAPLKNLTSLKTLTIYYQGDTRGDISSLKDLAGLHNLVDLVIGGTKVSDISPLAGLTKLDTLAISTNDIKDISPLSNLTSIEHLSIAQNHIDNISPLSGLTNLKSLEADENEISDVSPLKGMTQLTSLDVRENGIIDLSPLGNLNISKFGRDFKAIGQKVSLPAISNPTPDANGNVQITAPKWIDGSTPDLASLPGKWISYDSASDKLSVNLPAWIKAGRPNIDYWFGMDIPGTDIDAFTGEVTGQLKVDNHTVTFDDANDSLKPPAAQTVYNGGTATKPADPSYTGYTFLGWYTDMIGGTKFDFSTPITSDMKLYAHWDINKYVVSFDANGGKNAPDPESVEYDSDATSPAKNPTRDGYTFDGWYTAANGGAKFDFTTPIKSDTKLYAHWTAVHNVSFDATDATDVPSAESVPDGSKATKPATNPTRKGYRFDGWYTAAKGGAKFDFSTPIKADTKLYAHWTALYEVSFDTEGAGDDPATESVASGSKATEPKAPKFAHYKFDGWYTDPDAGSRYDFTKPVTSDVRLYAHWTALPYKVSFDARNGVSIPAQIVRYNHEATDPEEPTLDGYTFDGWYTDANAGVKFDFAKTPITEDITLYAHWTKAAPVNPDNPDNPNTPDNPSNPSNPSNPGDNGGTTPTTPNKGGNGTANHVAAKSSANANAKKTGVLGKTGSDTRIVSYVAGGLAVLGCACYGVFLAMRRRRH